MERVRAVTLEEARAFHADFYGPQSGNLVVVGDFDPAEIRPVLEGAFGDWASPHAFARIPEPFGDPPPEDVSIETPDKANAVLLVQQNLELTDADEDFPALALAGYALGGGPLNSRLARRIRVESGLSYTVGGQIGAHPIDPVGQFLAFAIFAPENLQKVEEAFRDEVAEVLAEGFTDEEIETARRGYLETRQLSRAQDASLSSQIASHLYFDRSFAYDADFEAAVRALSTAEVNEALRRHLDLSKMTFVKAGDFGSGSPPIGP
ncbi:MAG TPA: insulinase family protein, partial [Longimicrobiales bacterium]|nr:insulinase family protein [Longimicrobiales bacterium]